MELTPLSIIPSLLAILLAIRTKNVLLSLFIGILVGVFILTQYDLFATLKDTITLFTTLLTTPWIVKTLMFAILVGSIIELLEKSGGIEGFIHYVSEKNSYINSPKKALLTSYLVGVVIFIESSITSLIAGAIGKPLCAKQRVTKEELAFVCDTTAAPISSLIMLNGWGALVLGLIDTQIQKHHLSLLALDTLLKAIS